MQNFNFNSFRATMAIYMPACDYHRARKHAFNFSQFLENFKFGNSTPLLYNIQVLSYCLLLPIEQLYHCQVVRIS